MLLAWLAVILVAIVYCLAHSLFSASNDFSLAVAFRWALSHWGAWPIVLPACFWIIRRIERRWSLVAGIALAAPFAVLGSSSFFYLIEQAAPEPWSFAQAIYHMLPVAGGTYLLFVGLAFWLLDPVMLDIRTREAVATQTLESLQVSKGQTQTRLAADDVEWVQAARNYVELFTGNDSYIMRASMKELESLLPSEGFLRLHRSYIVNRESVDGLRRNTKGEPRVILRSGKSLPVGRSYRDEALAILGFSDKAA